MTIRENDVAAMRGCALLPGDSEPGLDHVTLTGRSVLLASLLAGHDLRPGGVVALVAEQSSSVYELLMGIRRAGLVLLVVDPAHTLEQNAFAINTSGALALIASTTQAPRARALIPLTPYIRVRFGLDGEHDDHRSLRLARSAAAVRVIEAAPAGTLHHTIGMSGRPVAVRLPDGHDDAMGRAHCRELLGHVVPGPGTVFVSSATTLSPTAALLGSAVLGAGGSVAVPRRPTGVEVLRTVSEVDGTLLHLSSAVAREVAELRPERVLRLTPPELTRVVVDGHGCEQSLRQALSALWGDALRVVEPAYLDAAEPPDSDSSITHAEI